MKAPLEPPRWIELSWMEVIHTAQIKAFGGSYGERDLSLIESAIMRPRHHWDFNREVTLADLAAIYAVGLAKNHGYVDGNKRVAFVTMNIFLELNGLSLSTPEPEVVSIMNEVAGGKMQEKVLAEWLRVHIQTS